MAFPRLKRILLHDKTAPLVTIVTATIAFTLSLIALLSNSDKGGLGQYDLVMLNTSTLLQNAVKIKTSSASVAARVVQVIQTPAPIPTDVLDERQLGLPNPSQVSSYFASIASGISSAISPQSTGTGISGTGSGGLLGDLESFFNDLVGTVAGAASTEIIQVINSIIKDVVNALGFQDWYGIYMTDFCDGKYAASPGLKTTSCNSYSNLKINSTNSTVAIGSTTLDFSALNLPAKLSKSTGQFKAILAAVIALQIIGIVSAGILILLTPLELFVPFFRKWFFHFTIGSLAAMSTACFATIAIATTGVKIAVSTLVNELGEGLGIEVYGGGYLLALLWISSLFMGAAAVLWFIRWHSHVYVRREMEPGSNQRPVTKTAESTFFL